VERKQRLYVTPEKEIKWYQVEVRKWKNDRLSYANNFSAVIWIQGALRNCNMKMGRFFFLLE
jgi:hypothetical protein